MDESKIWGAVLERLKCHLSEEMFDRWFSATSLAADTGTGLTVEIPNPIHQFWIESNFVHVLQAAVVEALGGPRAISFVVRGNGEMEESDLGSGTELVLSGRAKSPEQSDIGVITPPKGAVEAEEEKEAKWRGKTFGTFVIGKNNQYASGAAMAVASKPGEIYNPLFIHGGAGLGKTHLLRAIGNFVLQQNPKARVIYVTSEDFMNAFIEALRAGEMTKFRRRFRRADVLLIDDIHFLGKKASTQEEFFHTFNELFDAHKQIVLTSDRPPSEIAHLEKRLVSRCEWGLMAELQVPDIETRTAILRNKMKEMGADVPDHLIDFLAANVRSNVRRLEGGLMRLASFQSLAHEPGELTIEVAEELLRDILGEEQPKAVSIGVIQKVVADHYDVRVADLVGPRRPMNIARPRQIAMSLARESTGLPLQAIADAFNRKDHGTVIHACSTVSKLAKDDAEMRKVLEQLRTKFGNGG